MTDRSPVTINGKTWIYDATSRTHRPVEAADRDHAAGQAADLELPSRGKSMGAGKGPAFDTRVSVEVVSYRVRLADADGVSAKAAIDGLVNCGVLKDDSTKEIAEIKYRQIKVKNKNEEKTELIIEEVLR